MSFSPRKEIKRRYFAACGLSRCNVSKEISQVVTTGVLDVLIPALVVEVFTSSLIKFLSLRMAMAKVCSC